jgi:hypothetical protein
MKFVVDKSRIPPDKQKDVRLVKAEQDLLSAMGNEQHCLQVCVHEAAHAIYMERVGVVPVLHGPVAFYDSTTDTFDLGEAAVHGNAGDGVNVESLAMARWYVAGGVAVSVLIGEGEDPIEPGDEQDFGVFTAELVKAGASPEQIASHWEQAKRDVKNDLRSPAFRRQIWDRARDLKQQLETLSDSISAEPQLQTVAYHESAHAVVAELLDFPIDYVTIIPTTESRGIVYGYSKKVSDDPGGDTVPSRIARISKTTLITVAGACAEYRLGTLRFGQIPDTDLNDLEHTSQLLTRVLNAPQLELYAVCTQTCMDLLAESEVWNAIEEAAKLLLERKTIEGDAVREIIKRRVGKSYAIKIAKFEEFVRKKSVLEETNERDDYSEQGLI